MSHLKNNPEWFKKWQHNFYSSQNKRWITLRNEIRDRDKMKCQSCNKFITGKSICDHIVEITPHNYTDESIIYNPDNLQMMCIECHNKKTFGNQKGFNLENRSDVNLF